MCTVYTIDGVLMCTVYKHARHAACTVYGIIIQRLLERDMPRRVSSSVLHQIVTIIASTVLSN